MIVLISVALSLLFVLLFYKYSNRRVIIPEGSRELPLEKGFPILGIIPQVKPTLYVYLSKLSHKHGPLFKIRMGMRDVVVLNDFASIKKTLKEHGDAFSGRPNIELFKIAFRNSGVLFTDGDTWAKQRSFILMVLRDFGLGKSKSQEIVQGECLHLIDELRKTEAKSVDFSHLIPVTTANIISKFIMGKRFSKGDPKLELIEKLIAQSAKGNSFLILFHIMFPMFDTAKMYCKMLLKIPIFSKRLEMVYSNFREEIGNHLKRLDLNVEGEDLIDRFLIKQHEMKEKTGSVDTFTEWQLIRNLLELFIAGFDTTSTTLGWSLLFMARFPDIQEKVYLEIVDNIGDERMVSMNDRKSLHYTQAVMDEIMRLGTVVPISITHRTLKDTVVDGYFIPKDAWIFPNIFACHTDPNIWDDPMEFKPERFLSVDDEGNSKYSPREELIPFSIGKRQCLGESLARMEFFIFFVTILQTFKVRFSENIGDKEYEDALGANEGSIRFSKIKDFIFSNR